MYNKAQGSAGLAVKMLIFLCMYFFSVTLIIYFVGQAESALGQNTLNATTTGSFGRFINATITQGQCSDPRYYVDGNGERKQYLISTSSLSCEQLFAFNQSQCNLVDGCSWQTVTQGSWWWQETNTTCTGYINDSYLSLGNSSYSTAGSIFGGKYLQFTSDILENTGGISVCVSPKANQNKNTCEMLGCTWTTLEQTSPTQAPSIWNAVSFMFGFNAEFLNVPAIVSIIFAFVNFLMLLVLILAIALFIKGF